MLNRSIWSLDFPMSTVLGLFAIVVAILGVLMGRELAIAPLYGMAGVMAVTSRGVAI
jgi:hypothetical protein